MLIGIAHVQSYSYTPIISRGIFMKYIKYKYNDGLVWYKPVIAFFYSSRPYAQPFRCLALTTRAGIGFTAQNCVCFLTFLMKFLRLFHELMNQYQACLYLVPMVIKLHNFTFCWICDLSSAPDCRVESINPALHFSFIACGDITLKQFILKPPFGLESM